MISNPFIPSQIATDPRDFVGRESELQELERGLATSNLIIDGAPGIGKSSLGYHLRLRMEGFDSDHNCRNLYAVCNNDLETEDDVARLLLTKLVDVNQSTKTLKWKVPWFQVFEFESAEVVQNFAEGRHLSTFLRLLQKDLIGQALDSRNRLLISIDESDRKPELLARFVRTVLTETQGIGIQNVRFVLSGIKSFFIAMVAEDHGMLRFFPSPLTLMPLQEDESSALLHDKFASCVREAAETDFELSVNPSVIDRIVEISGGHPHLLQLLGSHVIDSENAEPDQSIDSFDLINALKRICYKDRASLYGDLIIRMEIEGMIDSFIDLLSGMSKRFPTRILRAKAQKLVDPDALRWLIDQRVIYAQDFHYHLEDELLKVKLVLDGDLRFFSQADLEDHYTLMTDLSPDPGDDDDDSDYEEWQMENNFG